jgi:isoleucyl-tRNA synthetase
VLVQLSQILAPFTPFLAEELYQKLTGGESVHLLDWPEAGRVNALVVSDMELVREYVNVGLSIRAKERQKVRQPIASVTVPTLGTTIDFKDILKDELNVKDVFEGPKISLDLYVTPELQREGLMREVIRYVQSARKDAGLNIDDRIKLSLSTDDKTLRSAISQHQKTIQDETLATDMHVSNYDYTTTIKIDGVELTISLEKS